MRLPPDGFISGGASFPSDQIGKSRQVERENQKRTGLPREAEQGGKGGFSCLAALFFASFLSAAGCRLLSLIFPNPEAAKPESLSSLSTN